MKLAELAILLNCQMEELEVELERLRQDLERTTP